MSEDYISDATLERFKIGVVRAISPYLIDARMEIDWDAIFESYAVEIRGYVWSEPVQYKEIKYPADWWQAFKARWFPDWAKMRWPVEYMVHVIDIKAVYPEFRPSVPDENYRFYVLESVGLERKPEGK